jgi:hypothetical protein
MQSFIFHPKKIIGVFMNVKDIAKIYHDIVDQLVVTSNGIQYFALFLEPNLEAIKIQSDVNTMKAIRQAYLLGILERSHLACITSLARADRWLQAVSVEIDNENVLGFAAALRGFLESSADSHDVMSILPGSIHKLFPYLYLVFVDSDAVERTFVSLPELEDRLIHYTYARKQKKGSTALPHHVNKSNSDYITKFEDFGVPGAKQLYSELCELTHPASPSVSCFFRESKNSIKLDFAQDNEIVADILTRFESTIENLTQFSMNPALMGLSFLHRLFDAWPAPKDAEVSRLGSTQQRLADIDNFVSTFASGSVDHEALQRSLK